MSTVVGLATWVLTAATPAPGSQDVNPTNGGSPGLAGFLFTFALAIVVIGLAISLVRGMRRMERNSRHLETPDEAAGSTAPSAPTAPTAPPAG